MRFHLNLALTDPGLNVRTASVTEGEVARVKLV